MLAIIIPAAAGDAHPGPTARGPGGRATAPPTTPRPPPSPWPCWRSGFPGFCVFLYAIRVLQSVQDLRSAFWLYAFENGVNIVLAVALAGPFGVRGIALSISIAYTVGRAGGPRLPAQPGSRASPATSWADPSVHVAAGHRAPSWWGPCSAATCRGPRPRSASWSGWRLGTVGRGGGLRARRRACSPSWARRRRRAARQRADGDGRPRGPATDPGPHRLGRGRDPRRARAASARRGAAGDGPGPRRDPHRCRRRAAHRCDRPGSGPRARPSRAGRPTTAPRL